MRRLLATISVVCLVFVVDCTKLEVGNFKTKDHGVNGTVYIDGDSTLNIKGFSYDGNLKNLATWDRIHDKLFSS
jgi:hypothetical protein